MNVESKQILTAFAAGFLSCLILLWYPTKQDLDRSRIAREDELGWIRENLLSKQQAHSLDEHEEEGADLKYEEDRSSNDDRQPP